MQQNPGKETQCPDTLPSKLKKQTKTNYTGTGTSESLVLNAEEFLSSTTEMQPIRHGKLILFPVWSKWPMRRALTVIMVILLAAHSRLNSIAHGFYRSYAQCTNTINTTLITWQARWEGPSPALSPTQNPLKNNTPSPSWCDPLRLTGR